MPQLSDSATQSGFPLDKADRCVKCGLCLPHCPTYELTRNEADSPRGRIALMQGLATQQLTASESLQGHLDGCLGCRACESVCPAQVPYGELIDAVRDDLQQRQATRGRDLRWLAPWLIHPTLRRGLRTLLRLLQASGLLTLARRLLPRQSGLARRLGFIPPISSPPARGIHALPPGLQARGQVQLFTGCVSELFDGRTLQDALRCLQHCGFEVELPEQQTCCGALHQHNGMTPQAQRLFRHNLQAFGDTEMPVLGTASGCTAMLAEYATYSDAARGAAFTRRVSDISSFIAHHWPTAPELRPLDAMACVQDPCTLRNVLGATRPVYELLEKIPELSIEPLAGNQHCCGAAGSMMFSHPEQADALLEAKLQAMHENRPDYLLTSNIGCALHLRAALRRRGLNTEVLHPLSLLARQIPGPA